MDTDQSNDAPADRQQKEESRLHKLIKTLNEWRKEVWVSFKTEAHTAKFWVEVAALIGVGIYTLFAALQWREMRDTVKATQQQLSDNRAVQAARIVVSMPPPTVDENFTPQMVMVNGKVVVKNVGQTAAVNLFAIPSPDCGWRPSQNHFVGMTVEKHSGGRTVPPNETAEFPFNQSLGRLEDMVAEKCSGAIYVWVSYDDVFNQRYDSKYCWEYYRQTKRWGYCPVTEP